MIFPSLDQVPFMSNGVNWEVRRAEVMFNASLGREPEALVPEIESRPIVSLPPSAEALDARRLSRCGAGSSH